MPAIRHITRGLIDGSLSSLGIVLGASISGDPKIMIAAGLGGGIANALSNVLSAFTAERAEVMIMLAKYEKAMVDPEIDLRDSKIYEKEKRRIQRGGLLDGAASFLGAMMPLVPFAFFGVKDGLFAAAILTIGMLFFLGLYLGKMAKENLIVSGTKMALFGVVTALLASSLEYFFR
jgi:predicted membrane protein (TIGR00267 family)